jgi:DNA-binding response OmpR family regulator
MTIDLEKYEVRSKERGLLTSTELDPPAFVTRKGWDFSREKILQHLWGTIRWFSTEP